MRAIQLQLGLIKFEKAVKHLKVQVEGALEISEQTEL